MIRFHPFEFGGEDPPQLHRVATPEPPTCRICQKPITSGQKADQSFLVRPDGITVLTASAHSRCVRPLPIEEEPLG